METEGERKVEQSTNQGEPQHEEHGAGTAASKSPAGSAAEQGAEAGETGSEGQRCEGGPDGRARSNSAKSRAWKVKGEGPGSPGSASAADHAQSRDAASDSTLAAAASALASSPVPSPSSSPAPQPGSSPSQGQAGGRQQPGGARGRGRRGSTKEGQSPSPPQSPQGGERRAHDDGASILGHRLQSPWTFWFSRKDRRRSNSITAGPSGTVVIDKKQDKKEHMDNLVQIGTCRTVEEFWHHYVYIQRASALPKESNLYFFRNQQKPMWETFPKGGCFVIKVDKRTGALDKMWEELLFASIGEIFEDPNVVGVEVSIRSKEDGLSVWTRINHPQLRQAIGEKLKLLLNLEDVMYKSNATSIKDRSTYKNAQKILVAS